MSFDLERLVRRNIKAMKPYSSARDEFEGDAHVFLDANENPYPTPYNRYPDPHQKQLKQKIASIKNIDASQIFLGNGSDEAIDLLVRTFCSPGVDQILISQPTYGMYTVSAEINDIKINQVSLTPTFDLDLNETLNAITPDVKLIFLCSPNNPSGNLLSKEKIVRLLDSFGGLVVIDEAYIDFADSESFVQNLKEYPNLVVLQTLSKAWGLAGIRIGICFASQEIISLLDKIKPPYNISKANQVAAMEQLSKENEKNLQVAAILRQRAILEKGLNEINCVLQVYPSNANFVLARFTNAKLIYQKLLGKGIVLRDRSNVLHCDNCLRITVGTPEENKVLLNELRAL